MQPNSHAVLAFGLVANMYRLQLPGLHAQMLSLTSSLVWVPRAFPDYSFLALIARAELGHCLAARSVVSLALGLPLVTAPGVP